MAQQRISLVVDWSKLGEIEEIQLVGGMERSYSWSEVGRLKEGRQLVMLVQYSRLLTTKRRQLATIQAE